MCGGPMKPIQNILTETLADLKEKCHSLENASPLL